MRDPVSKGYGGKAAEELFDFSLWPKYSHTQAHKSPDLSKFIKNAHHIFLARKTLPACALCLTEQPKEFQVEGRGVVVTAEGTISCLENFWPVDILDF